MAFFRKETPEQRKKRNDAVKIGDKKRAAIAAERKERSNQKRLDYIQRKKQEDLESLEQSLIREVDQLQQKKRALEIEEENRAAAVSRGDAVMSQEALDRLRLWITPDAVLTVELIDCHFRKLAKGLHPDVNGGRGGDQFIELNQARERLLRLVK